MMRTLLLGSFDYLIVICSFSTTKPCFVMANAFCMLSHY